MTTEPTDRQRAAEAWAIQHVDGPAGESVRAFNAGAAWAEQQDKSVIRAQADTIANFLEEAHEADARIVALEAVLEAVADDEGCSHAEAARDAVEGVAPRV